MIDFEENGLERCLAELVAISQNYVALIGGRLERPTFCQGYATACPQPAFVDLPHPISFFHQPLRASHCPSIRFCLRKDLSAIASSGRVAGFPARLRRRAYAPLQLPVSPIRLNIDCQSLVSSRIASLNSQITLRILPADSEAAVMTSLCTSYLSAY